MVAKSLVALPSARIQIRFVEIPPNEYPPIQQACVVLKSSKQQPLAQRFLAYIRGPEASNILQKYGFEVPSTKTAPPLR
jgi:molybdate transport system substrate-binding protein